MAVKTKSERGPAGTLTVDDLTRAIKNSIDRTGMKEEEARAMAQHVLNFFGYSERIIDNVLEPEGLTKLLDRPQGLRAELVREDGVIRVPADRQGQRKAEGIRFLPRQDGREPGQGLRVERMEVPLPRAARRIGLSEQPGEALLFDDQAGVQTAQFQRDPAVERAGAVHAGPSARAD